MPIITSIPRRRERLRCNVRAAERRDIPAILGIAQQTSHEPRDEEQWLADRIEQDAACVVAEHFGVILGYATFTIHPSHVEILGFAVRPGFRRRGVGLQLANHLLIVLSDCERVRRLARRSGEPEGTPMRLQVDVPETSNSVAFWAEMGFKAALIPSYTREPDTYRFSYTVEGRS